MKYIYIPAGRKLWFDLAVDLKDKYGHEPAFWYGDDALLQQARTHFSGSVFQSLRSLDYAKAVPVGGLFKAVVASPDFHWIKDEAIKMLDRIDAHDLWGRKVRDAYFFRALTLACYFIETSGAEFFLSSESPHDFFAYVLWRACGVSGIPCIHFEAISIAPAMVMVSSRGGTLNKIARYPGCENEGFENVLLSAENYCMRFSGAAKPGYMLRQEHKEKVHDKLYRRLRDKLLRIVPLALAVTVLIRCREMLGVSVEMLSIFERRLKLWGRDKTTELKTAYLEKLKGETYLNYVYFPLHYEPERTTSPDGGVYYDQARAVLEIRSRLPPEVLLVVKEHPSQLYKNMRGYKGRSKLFYELLGGVQGIRLASLEIPSSELIRDCLAVVTVTGTAALEASMLGKPSFVLGAAWFVGAPNVYAHSDVERFTEIVGSNSPSGVDELLTWLSSYLSTYAFFGCVNPSNEKVFAGCMEALAVQRPFALSRQIDLYFKEYFQRLAVE